MLDPKLVFKDIKSDSNCNMKSRFLKHFDEDKSFKNHKKLLYKNQ